ncbi:MAG: class I SAM-dependent methyltransferase [Deltaproteobacteria bacterium]|nr:class I SAM-dependent methyltransferase [Deltaproteobacteria bacterium]
MATLGMVKVFDDVTGHRRAATIIKNHSTNTQDIREVALAGLDLSSCRQILDLGCGFGFFTEGLKGKVHPDAIVTGVDVIGDYEEPFLDACRHAGVKGRFLPARASLIGEFAAATFDLVLCSYALYFFPRIIPYLARITREKGIFITITHNRDNMRELIEAVKRVLPEAGAGNKRSLPVEKLIAGFSSENGAALLSPWFSRVQAIGYHNSLIFSPDDIRELLEYFRFKTLFFLSETPCDVQTVTALLAGQLQRIAVAQNRFVLLKDDGIFICTDPQFERKAS